jgi:hypothetical protein
MAAPFLDTESVPLYATEEQCARLVLGVGKIKEWQALAIVWEGQGLPQIDPQTGARYWPAVKAWLDRRYDLRKDAPKRPDGVEKPWSGSKTRRALSSAPTKTVNVHSIGEHRPR